MGEFGALLRDFRSAQGLTQQQFVATLPGRFARSTLAIIEAGCQAPDTTVSIMLNMPTDHVAIHLALPGPKPRRAWRFGPVAHETLRPTTPDQSGTGALAVGQDDHVSSVLAQPALGAEHGVTWLW